MQIEVKETLKNKMDKIKSLLGNDSEESDEAVLLSQILAARGGYIPQKELQIVLEYASELQASPEPRRPQEQAWLTDFIQNIGQVFAAERELDSKVAHRSRITASPEVETEVKEIARTAEQQQLSKKLESKDKLQNIWSKTGNAGGTIKLNELVVRPEKFDGVRTAARRWLEDYESAAVANDWEDRIMVKYFSTFLVKSAKDWFVAVAQPMITENTQWRTLRTLFVRYYLGPEEMESVRDELRKTRQKREEPATDFIARIMRLLRITDPHLSEKSWVQEIRKKLRDEIQDRLLGQHPETLVALNDLCLEIETRLETIRHRGQFQSARPSKTSSGQQPKANPNGDRKKQTEKGEARDKPKYKCSHCGKDGHSIDRCWTKYGKPEKKKTTAAAVEKQQVKEETAPKITTIKNVCSVVALAREDEPDCIMQTVELQGKTFRAMIDTGSKLSIIRADVAEGLGLRPDGSRLGLVGADRQELNCLGMVTATLKLSLGSITKIVEIKFVVIQNLCVEVLLGNQLLGWLNVLVSPARKAIKFEDESKGVCLNEDTTLEPRSQTVVGASIPIESNAVIATTNFHFTHSILVANTVDRVTVDKTIKCLLVNLEPSAIKLQAGTQIAGYEVIATEEKKEAVNTAMQVAESDEFVRVGSDLTKKQCKELQRLINENKEAFSIFGSIGETDLVEHDIELVENVRPVAEPLRRRPLTHRLEAQRQVKAMLDKGIIEHSSSPWASAYVLVKKKTGDIRMCIDFRKLNEVTKKNVYPLPNVEDCLEALSGNQFFSQLDLASGYWQIRMADRARELTAFRTEEGLYQFRRMPFGLCNAPASFQRLVNALFAGLKGVHLQVFIDDICIASRTWDEHLALLRQVFELLINAKLRLKANKCVFGASKVIFLGHELSRDGIRQDPMKVQAINQLRAPTNVGEVRRVLGLFGYYRRFVPNFATIAEPLNRLTRKDVEFRWSNEHEMAFEELKRALNQNIVLAQFNHQDPILLKTDASRVGVAAILLQQQKGEWRIITCCSRRLCKAEENYGISDLEGLAIVFAVGKLRNYLLGKRFTILTDHCALCALKLKTPTSARLHRWAIILSEFDFEIKYIKGGLHMDVDCLSRAPMEEYVDPWLDDKVIAATRAHHTSDDKPCAMVMPQDAREWRTLSENDQEAVPHFEKARKRVKGYKIFNGSLYLENRLYVPNAKRMEILAEGHADGPSGHGGVRATLERLSGLWWPSMANDTRKFIDSCQICQARKVERSLPAGQMHSFGATEPFELVAVDALGPLPPSIRGKKHVLVVIDCFSRYIDAEATEDVQGHTFTDYFKRFIGRFGIPQAVLSDNAPTFCNESMKQVVAQFKIEHKKSTPHHHQGNAIVERVIQTLQEKLALITHDPTSTVDWEEALTAAILSINTTTHSSTGYTPFEIIFGKRHALRSALVAETNQPHNSYLELRELRSQQIHSEAIARQAEAQAVAKKYYDQVHRARHFDIGDLVLSRVMGRRTKLQNRFVGPYKVESRQQDVYWIVNVDGRSERLQRHVSDLKPYRVRRDVSGADGSDSDRETDKEHEDGMEGDPIPPNFSSASVLSRINTGKDNANSPHSVVNTPTEKMSYQLWILMVIGSTIAASEIEFQEAPLVSWLPTRTYVSPSPTSFKLVIQFAEPCQVLKQFRIGQGPMDETEQAVRLCQGYFFELVTGKLNQWATYQSTKPSILLPSPMQPNNNGFANVIPQPVGKGKGPEYTVGNPRIKRGILDFCVGCFVSNILQTVEDRIWPNPAVEELKDQLHAMEHKVTELNRQANFTELQIIALAESQKLTTQLVEQNIHQIHAMQFTYPALAVVSSNIIAKMHLVGSYIDKLRVSFRSRRPDIEIISLLYNFDDILEVDPNSVIEESVRMTSPNRNVLQLEFTARRRSPDTTVYQVNAFRYWGNLMERKAKLYEYVGPRYVIQNVRYQCVKGITQIQTGFITAQCTERNFEDRRLSNWKVVTEEAAPQNYPEQTEVIEVWPYVFVYCYPGNITLANKTVECPSYAFRLNATVRWTTGTYDYSPSAIEVNLVEQVAAVVDNIGNIHNASHPVNKDQAVKRIHELHKAVDAWSQQVIAVQVAGRDVTYKHTTYAMSTLLLILSIITIGYGWRKARATVEHIRELETKMREENMRRTRNNLNHVYARIQAPAVEPPMITWK